MDGEIGIFQHHKERERCISRNYQRRSGASLSIKKEGRGYLLALRKKERCISQQYKRKEGCISQQYKLKEGYISRHMQQVLEMCIFQGKERCIFQHYKRMESFISRHNKRRRGASFSVAKEGRGTVHLSALPGRKDSSLVTTREVRGHFSALQKKGEVHLSALPGRKDASFSTGRMEWCIESTE